MSAPLVVLAIATDGFKPGNLLEVAALAIDRATPQLVVEPCVALTPKHALATVEAILSTEDGAAQMHAENGLLGELLESGGDAPLEEVDAFLASWIDKIGAGGEERSPLVCFSPDWMRPWLKAFLPTTLRRLHLNDVIDVGALARALRIPINKGNGRAATVANEASLLLAGILPVTTKLNDLRSR